MVEAFEVLLAWRAGSEVDEHRSRRSRLVAEAVDPARWDMGEVADAGVDPFLTIKDAHCAGQDVERLGHRAVEVGIRPAPAWAHRPPIEPEQATGRVPGGEIVHLGPAGADQVGLGAGSGDGGADGSVRWRVEGFWISHW